MNGIPNEIRWESVLTEAHVAARDEASGAVAGAEDLRLGTASVTVDLSDPLVTYCRRAIAIRGRSYATAIRYGTEVDGRWSWSCPGDMPTAVLQVHLHGARAFGAVLERYGIRNVILETVEASGE